MPIERIDMALLRPDLSVDPTVTFEVPIPAHATPGLTTHGHIQTSYYRLRETFGQPDHQSKLYRTAGAWALDTPAGRVNLLRLGEAPGSAGDRDVESRWTIRSESDTALPWIYKAVTGSTATFPAGAVPYFTESTLDSFANAYLDYLYERMLAETDRRPDLDRNAPDFRTNHQRPQQINSMLISLAQVLHHYEWSQASAAEREEWARMDRPVARSSSNHYTLRYWRERNRWLYEPVISAQHPHGGNPDLSGMLRTLADTTQEHRPMLRDQVPTLDFALHEEHERTLRALADTPVPGIDALRDLRI